MSTNNLIQSSSSDVVVFNPSEIFGMYSDYVAREVGWGVVCVRGIFRRGTGKVYYGYYYDSIFDQSSGQELGIKIPESLRDKLEDGNLVDLAGVIERKISQKGYIQLNLAVTRADIILEQTMSEDDMKRAEIRKRKSEAGFKNVDLILESKLMADERPRIALVFAESSITDADFNAGKEAAEAKIDFREYRVNFANPGQVVSVLSTLDNDGFDAIALIRGGGSGIEHLDDIGILERVCNMSVPLICAVGHVEEKLFIKYIADKVAPTPNGLGAYFKDKVETIALKRNNSREVLAKQIESQFKEQIETARKQNADLQGKIELLTRNSESSQKLHKEQLETANRQNADLQKRIEEMNRGSEAGRKASEEQMTKLNAQLTELQRTNKSQGEMFAAQLKDMQDNNGKLQRSINDYSDKLARAESRCAQLQSQLEAKSGSGATVPLIIAIFVIVILILALASR